MNKRVAVASGSRQATSCQSQQHRVIPSKSDRDIERPIRGCNTLPMNRGLLERRSRRFVCPNRSKYRAMSSTLAKGLSGADVHACGEPGAKQTQAACFTLVWCSGMMLRLTQFFGCPSAFPGRGARQDAQTCTSVLRSVCRLSAQRTNHWTCGAQKSGKM